MTPQRAHGRVEIQMTNRPLARSSIQSVLRKGIAVPLTKTRCHLILIVWACFSTRALPAQDAEAARRYRIMLGEDQSLAQAYLVQVTTRLQSQFAAVQASSKESLHGGIHRFKRGLLVFASLLVVGALITVVSLMIGG